MERGPVQHPGQRAQPDRFMSEHITSRPNIHPASQQASAIYSVHGGKSATHSQIKPEPIQYPPSRGQRSEGQESGHVPTFGRPHVWSIGGGRSPPSTFTKNSDRTERSGHIARPALSLQIEHSRDVPLHSTTPPSSTSSVFPPRELFEKPPLLTPPTSLPSLGMLGHLRTSYLEDLAPRSVPPCRRCASLKPLIDDISNVAVRLIVNVTLSRKGAARVRLITTNHVHPAIIDQSQVQEPPKADLLELMQWVLQRLQSTEREMHNLFNRGSSTSVPAQPPMNTIPGMSTDCTPRSSPSASMKRTIGPSTEESTPDAKRARSDIDAESYGNAAFGSHSRNDHSRPPSLASQVLPPIVPSPEHGFRRPAQIPQASFITPPISAIPVPQSASHFHDRPQIPHHVSNPLASATLAHVSDLQHQVTVKTLALQSLEAEHASLLQKFRRERTRTQALEVKAGAAEREVNDLAGKCEDAMDQCRSVEAQLEETENKLEAERVESARARAQWLVILRQAGQLSIRSDVELREAPEKKAGASQHILGLSTDDANSGVGSSDGGFFRQPLCPCTATSNKCGDSATSSDRQATSSEAQLMREITTHKERIEILRRALEEARRQNEQFLHDAQALWRRHQNWSSSVVSVLADDESKQSSIIQPVRRQVETLSDAASPPARHSNMSSIHSMLNFAGSTTSARPGARGAEVTFSGNIVVGESFAPSDSDDTGSLVSSRGGDRTISSVAMNCCKSWNLPNKSGGGVHWLGLEEKTHEIP